MKEKQLTNIGANFHRSHLEGFVQCPECSKEFRWFIKELNHMKEVLDAIREGNPNERRE